MKLAGAVQRLLNEERSHDARLKEYLVLRREALRRGQDERVESIEIFLERELRRHQEFLAQGRKELGADLFERAMVEAQKVLEADKAELYARIQSAARPRPASGPAAGKAQNAGGRAGGRAQRPPGAQGGARAQGGRVRAKGAGANPRSGNPRQGGPRAPDG